MSTAYKDRDLVTELVRSEKSIFHRIINNLLQKEIEKCSLFSLFCVFLGFLIATRGYFEVL